MNAFFIKLGNNPIYKKLMKDPLTYVAGAVLLAIFQIVHFAVFNYGWGVSSAFANWGAWIYQLFGGDVSGWAFFSSKYMQTTLAQGFFADGTTVRNLGVILGALVATLYASQFKIKMIKSKKQIVAAVLGGLLMGYSARVAGGCNIGALFTGISALSLSGWVFGIFLMFGAFLGCKLLVKYFM